MQKTHWPNIDLIGAQLNLYWAEFQIPVWRMQGRGWKLWDALTDTLEADGLLDDYDLVFLDTPPALGYLTINGLAAADILLVPLGASFLEFDSTGRFFDMLHATFALDRGGREPRRPGAGPRGAGLPVGRGARGGHPLRRRAAGRDGGLMQAYLGKTLSPHRQGYTALIGQAGEQVQGIYEADYRDFNRETYARGRETFDATYAAFKRLLVGAWRRDETRGARGRGMRFRRGSTRKMFRARNIRAARARVKDRGRPAVRLCGSTEEPCMAKRKRLTPANPDFLEPAERAKPSEPRSPGRAPIADVARDASAAAALAEMARDPASRARGGPACSWTCRSTEIEAGHLVRDRIARRAEEMAGADGQPRAPAASRPRSRLRARQARTARATA